MAVQLEDWVPVYPSQDDQRIQTLFTAKKEFDEMSALMKEPVPKRGQLYRHQKAFVRMMRAYDRVLNIAETGSGKTCQFVGVAQFYKHNRSTIRHVYVFEKGPATSTDFEDQIVRKCSQPGEYETEMVRRARTETVRKGNITRELHKWYTVTTYRTFANQVRTKRLTDEEIIAQFSGCLFLLDEAHNIRNDGIHKERELQQVYETLHRVFHLVLRSKIVVSTATPMINDVNEIPRIANLILPLDRQMPLDWDYTKVTLAQMEPFFRGRVTFVRNLDTGAVPVYQGEYILNENGERASYTVQIPDPKWQAPPYKPGGPQPSPPLVERKIQSQVIVYASHMVPGGIQDRTYQRLAGGTPILGLDMALEESKAEVAHNNKRQAAAFVFPDGSYGGKFPRERDSAEPANEGLAKYVTSSKAGQYTITPEFRRVLQNPQRLQEMSCKFATIVNIECNEPGCAFVFSDFKTGGGAILLGLCFEAYGFERYSETQSVFIVGPDGQRRIRPSFPKRPRYVLLLGSDETSNPQITSMMELFNSEENAFGEYIKVMIGSPVARDGINLAHVLRGHLVTAGWHPSGILQALSRFLRATSHEYLLSLLRRDLAEQSLDPETKTRLDELGIDPASASIEVKVYKHVAVDSRGNSIDRQLYQLAEWKDLFIRRMMRILKQCAIDCWINYQRNVRPAPQGGPPRERKEYPEFGVPLPDDFKMPPCAREQSESLTPLVKFSRLHDIDYSPACDYEVCEYKCVSPRPEELDFSTYDILYADEVIASVINDLTKLLRDRGSVTFAEIRDMWVTTGEYREKFIYMAIDRMLFEKRQLLDRFGFGCYIQTDGFNVYTQREFPTSEVIARSGAGAPDLPGVIHAPTRTTGAELAIYSEQIIGIDAAPFKKIAAESSVETQSAVIREMQDIKDPTQGDGLIEFNVLLDRLSLDSKVKLLEQSIATLAEGNRTPIAVAVFQRFYAYIFETPEPWEDIESSSLALASRGQGQGRKPSSAVRRQPRTEFKGAPGEGTLTREGKEVETIYMHTLYSTNVELTSYSVTSDFSKAGGLIRILKRSENLAALQPESYGWRDANQYEEPVYNFIIMSLIRERLKKYEQYELYGTILHDRKFRIVDKTTEKTTTDKTDRRVQHKGKICTTWDKAELIQILYREGVEPPAETPIPTMSREEMIQYLMDVRYTKEPALLEQYSLEQLQYVVRWYQSRANRSFMCNMIRQSFQEADKLLIV